MSRNCFVPLCKEGYPSTRSTNKVLGIRNKTLFKAPKDPKVLAQWVKAIPRSDRDLRSGIDRVCEKHFAEIFCLHFVCSRSNSIDNAKKEKSKLHRKSAKLV